MTVVARWSDWACAGGVRRGAVTVVSGTYGEALDGSDACDFVILHDARNAVEVDDVLRVIDDLGVVREYRVNSRENTRGVDTRRITGLPPLADLNTSGRVGTLSGGLLRYDVGGRYTLTELIDDFILADLTRRGITHFARGTIEPTGLVTVTAPAEGWTHLQWLREGVAAVDPAAGGAELRLRRNGDTEFLIDVLTEVGSTAAVVTIAEGRNLLALVDKTDDGESASAITVLGSTEEGNTSPATIAENAWLLGTIPGGAPYWIPLTDPADGAAPIVFDAQVDDLYLLRSDGGLTQITDSRASDSAVLVAATTGLTAGHHVQIVADSSATRLTELARPGVRRLHRTDLAPSLRGERSLLRNGLFLNWTDAFTPELWSAQGGTMDVGEYPRDEPATHSGIVVNGTNTIGAAGIQFRAAPAGARFYSVESLDIAGGGGAFTVGNVVAEADGSGNGSIVFASGTLAATVGDGTAITFFGNAPKRPTSFPTERDANNVCRLLSGGGNAIPPTATQVRFQSEAFTVKYIAGDLALLNAAVGFTCHNGTGSEVGNLDGGSAITDDLSLAVTRRLPGLMLRNTSGPTRLGWSAIAQRIAANTTAHATVSVRVTLSADTNVDLCLLAQNLTSLWTGARWATLWLGPSELVPPYPGSWGNVLLQRCNRGLLARALTARSITVSLIDLSVAAGYSITREQITIGGTVRLRDLALSVRIVGVVWHIDRPETPDVIVSAMPPRLTRFQAERL